MNIIRINFFVVPYCLIIRALGNPSPLTVLVHHFQELTPNERDVTLMLSPAPTLNPRPLHAVKLHFLLGVSSLESLRKVLTCWPNVHCTHGLAIVLYQLVATFRHDKHSIRQ